MANNESNKDLNDEMTLAEIVEMALLRKRIKFLESKYDIMSRFPSNEYVFDKEVFVFGELREIDDVFFKLLEIQDLYEGK